MPDFIPKAALDYIKNKTDTVGFSYKDVWHEEHASAFTVAKAMQLDVLSDLHSAVTAAIENCQSFDTFKKSIKPTLESKGWWGKKEMTDPLTGKTVNAQLGSDRRLKTIYHVNMRSAYQKGQYDRTMESDLHPYLMYRIGPSIHHRKDHESWDGLILPKDDPWWDSHLPPNGWGCKCYTRAVSEARKKKYETEGVPVPPRADGSGGGTLKVKTDAPPVTYKTYFNERKGTVEQVPNGVDPAFNWNVGKAKTGAAAAQKLQEATANYEAAVKQAPKPKKEYLTKKKLEADIGGIDSQLKTLADKYGGDVEGKGSAADKKLHAELSAKKNTLGGTLDKKLTAGQKKTLTKQQAVLQKKLDGIPVKTYSGIWKEDVTTADFESKSSSISAKKAYFQVKIDGGGLSAEDAAKFELFIKNLDEFEAEGKAYYAVKAELQSVKNHLTSLKNSGSIKYGAEDAFAQARRNAALWAKSTKDADTVLRGACGEVWKNASKPEREAIYDYTSGSGKFNRPLSGFRKPYNDSGSGWESKFFKGINKVWIDYEGAGDEIRAMTDLISRSSYDTDMWLQRGCGTGAIESFLGISNGTLSKMTQKELDEFVGHKNRFYSFQSTAVSKGKGFSGSVIMNIYAPKGTQMMYAEPFSAYGSGGGSGWDGISKQSNFGRESEMIVQRGASYTITKIEKTGGQIYIDLEIHPEKGYELIQQNPAEWKGKKDKYR